MLQVFEETLGERTRTLVVGDADPRIADWALGVPDFGAKALPISRAKSISHHIRSEHLQSRPPRPMAVLKHQDFQFASG